MNEHDLVSVYVGSAINARYIEAILSQAQIASLVKNELSEATHGGFGGPSPEEACEIFVEAQDYEKAEKIIYNYLNSTSV